MLSREGGLQPDVVEGMRAAGRLAGALLDQLEREIAVGMSTADLDRLVDEATTAAGAISAPMGYRGFPAHCCTSINNVVCHGIPDPRRLLRDGDIVNVDVTPILRGYHGDASRTFLIGDVAAPARQLVADTTPRCGAASPPCARAVPSVTSATPFRASSSRAGTRSCASFVATVSAASSTLHRPSCTPASRARASDWRRG